MRNDFCADQQAVAARVSVMSVRSVLVGLSLAAGLGFSAQAASAATILEPLGSAPIGSSLSAAGNTASNGLLDVFFSFSLPTPENVEFTYSANKPLSSTITLFQGGTCAGTSCSGGSAVPGGTLTGVTGLLDLSNLILSPGSYYFDVKTTVAGASSGSRYRFTGSLFTSAVPEPAAWSMLILGFFGLGGLMRARSKPARVTA